MKHLRQKGFSLIELMVVLAIIGILTTLVLPKVKDFSRAAKQTEAKLNVGVVANLIKPYVSDGNTLGSGVVLSGSDFSSPSSCYVANNVGFRLTDCTKVNYQYVGSGSAENVDSTFAVAAEVKEGGVPRIFKECVSKDVWAGGDGKLTQMSSPKTNCGTNLLTLWLSTNGNCDGSFDLNGDGCSSGSEFLILQRILW